MFTMVVVLAYALYHGYANQARFAKQGHESHDYLCFQKAVGIPQQKQIINNHIQSTLTYETQVELGQRKPIPGITSADLARGIASDQADLARLNSTLKALSKVNC